MINLQAEINFEEAHYSDICGCMIPATWVGEVVSDFSDHTNVDRIYSQADTRQDCVNMLISEIQRIIGKGKGSLHIL